MDGGYTVIAKGDNSFGSFTFHSAAEAIAKAKELIADGLHYVVIRDRGGDEYSLDRFLEIFAR